MSNESKEQNGYLIYRWFNKPCRTMKLSYLQRKINPQIVGCSGYPEQIWHMREDKHVENRFVQLACLHGSIPS